MPRAEKIDRFEMKLFHQKDKITKKLCDLIKVADDLKIPVSETCDSIDFDYGIDGNGIVRAHVYFNVYLKNREQLKNIMEAINDTN